MRPPSVINWFTQPIHICQSYQIIIIQMKVLYFIKSTSNIKRTKTYKKHAHAKNEILLPFKKM